MEQLLSTNIPISEIALRMAMAAVFGMIIGLDRELHGRAAGLRTNMLIALAACIFTILALELAAQLSGEDGIIRADPLRIFGAITTGVAFLAAGTIIRSGEDIRGLTTGAAMWLVAAIGVACGVGFYAIAVLSTLFAAVTITLIGALERRYFRGRGGKK